MEKRWVSLENVIRDGISIPTEIMEISRQTKDIFYSWGGLAIQKIFGIIYGETSNYLLGDVVFACEIIPHDLCVDILTFKEITESGKVIEDLYDIPFSFPGNRCSPYVELPKVFCPAKHIFANLDKLNQAVYAKHHKPTVTNPGIDQRCETSYKTLIAVLLAKAGKHPWADQGGKAAVVKWLARELQSLGCAMSEKTIGKHLDGLPEAVRKKEIGPISRK